METTKISVKGFTLIELMITVAIVAILAAIAIPSYTSYTRRSYYAEVVDATSPYKVSVSECYQQVQDISKCNGGSNGIPTGITTPTGNIFSLGVTAGVITSCPQAIDGLQTTDCYILTATPTSDHTNVTWAASGPGISLGYAS